MTTPEAGGLLSGGRRAVIVNYGRVASRGSCVSSVLQLLELLLQEGALDIVSKCHVLAEASRKM